MILYKRLGKRVLDIVVSGLGLLLMSPVLLLIGIMVWLKLGRPILFTQVRPGYMARPFTMYKFRTMKNDKNNQGELLSDEERITLFGRWLRSTSLDELPELFNVIFGHMSLVGPRPLLMSYLPLYSKDQYRRHEVKPGITGLAQVSGRNNLSWPKRLAIDVEYVNHVSFWLDIKILFKTIFKVIRREGIVSEGFVSSAPFRGETEDET
jgi:lipopolysaccharide/colanic/teichoic acid biosynthesis glycosyltransferase